MFDDDDSEQPPPAPTTVMFQDGNANSYSRTRDTTLSKVLSDAQFAKNNNVVVFDGPFSIDHGLLRFDDMGG